MLNLNVYGLSAPKLRIMKLNERQDLTIYCLHEIYLECKNINLLKAKSCKMIYYANTNYNKTVVAILIQVKVEVSSMVIMDITNDIM